MSNYIPIFPEILLAVILASVIGILFLTVSKIVSQTSLFQGKTAIVFSLLISVSVTAVCAQLLVLPSNVAGAEHQQNVTLNYSLLPAMILGGLVVMLELFVIAAITASPNNKDEILAKKPVHLSTKTPKSPRRQKQKSAEQELKEAPEPVGSTS